MKTKNRKWIGAVPISLVAALALAAFISAGLLLAPNGVQPVGAQEVDCTIDVTAGDNADTAMGLVEPVTVNGTDPVTVGCTVSGNTAVIALPGKLGASATSEQPVWVYAQMASIAGGTTLTDVFDHDQTAARSPNTPSPVRFSAIQKTIMKATPAGVGGGGIRGVRRRLR